MYARRGGQTPLNIAIIAEGSAGLLGKGNMKEFTAVVAERPADHGQARAEEAPVAGRSQSARRCSSAIAKNSMARGHAVVAQG